MKRVIVFFITVVFMITSVIMPYSNYDDARAVISLYNNSLYLDTDMTLLEFVGEKLIASGIEIDEEEDTPVQNNETPYNHKDVIQIQVGVLFHKQETQIKFSTYGTPVKLGSSYNTKISKENFCPGIFRPPAA